MKFSWAVFVLFVVAWVCLLVWTILQTPAASNSMARLAAPSIPTFCTGTLGSWSPVSMEVNSGVDQIRIQNQTWVARSKNGGYTLYENAIRLKSFPQTITAFSLTPGKQLWVYNVTDNLIQCNTTSIVASIKPVFLTTSRLLSAAMTNHFWVVDIDTRKLYRFSLINGGIQQFTHATDCLSFEPIQMFVLGTNQLLIVGSQFFSEFRWDAAISTLTPLPRKCNAVLFEANSNQKAESVRLDASGRVLLVISLSGATAITKEMIHVKWRPSTETEFQNHGSFPISNRVQFHQNFLILGDTVYSFFLDRFVTWRKVGVIPSFTNAISLSPDQTSASTLLPFINANGTLLAGSLTCASTNSSTPTYRITETFQPEILSPTALALTERIFYVDIPSSPYFVLINNNQTLVFKSLQNATIQQQFSLRNLTIQNQTASWVVCHAALAPSLNQSSTGQTHHFWVSVGTTSTQPRFLVLFVYTETSLWTQSAVSLNHPENSTELSAGRAVDPDKLSFGSYFRIVVDTNPYSGVACHSLYIRGMVNPYQPSRALFWYSVLEQTQNPIIKHRQTLQDLKVYLARNPGQIWTFPDQRTARVAATNTPVLFPVDDFGWDFDVWPENRLVISNPSAIDYIPLYFVDASNKVPDQKLLDAQFTASSGYVQGFLYDKGKHRWVQNWAPTRPSFTRRYTNAAATRFGNGVRLLQDTNQVVVDSQNAIYLMDWDQANWKVAAAPLKSWVFADLVVPTPLQTPSFFQGSPELLLKNGQVYLWDPSLNTPIPLLLDQTQVSSVFSLAENSFLFFQSSNLAVRKCEVIEFVT